MKKIIYLFSLAALVYSCEPRASEQAAANSEVMAMSSLSKAEVKNDIAISVADVHNSGQGAVDFADVESTVDEYSPRPQREEPKKPTPQVIKKKIIKDGRLGLQVKNVEKVKQHIDSLLKSVGGYYASENLQNSDQSSGYQLTIRIPVISFEKFISGAENSSGKVLFKEITARDVTEEFVDLQTRLASKRNSLARYNEIMKKASSVKDIVEIEEAIRVLQEEIESSEGKLRFLNDCVDYSTLNLTISTEKDFTYRPVKRNSFWEKWKESIVEGWFGMVDFILWLFGMWPFLIIVTALYFLIRKWFRKRRLRKQQPK
jgi:hypothetical protein